MSNNRLDTLKQMEAQQPGDAFIKYAIATEHVGMGNDTDALGYFEYLVNNHPQYVATYLHLGKLYERIGKTGEALSCYKRGMEIAKTLKDNKTLGELNEAYTLAEDE
jgi:tetratricopeptide (TPR) repeat protein